MNRFEAILLTLAAICVAILIWLLMSMPAHADTCQTIGQLKTEVVPLMEKMYGKIRNSNLKLSDMPKFMAFYNAVPPASTFEADEAQIITTSDQDINFVFLFKDGCFVNGSRVNQKSLEMLLGANT